MPHIRNRATEQLYRAFTKLRTEAEVEAFLEDLCTIQEIRSMAQRLNTAAALKNGQSYLDISKEVGVSTATITRVNRCIQYGAGGYQTVLERLEEEA